MAFHGLFARLLIIESGGVRRTCRQGDHGLAEWVGQEGVAVVTNYVSRFNGQRCAPVTGRVSSDA